MCVEIRQLEMFDEPLDVVFVDVHLDRRRSEAMTSGIVKACPRSLLLASPVVRVIQNENRRSEKIVFNVKDEFCKQTKTNESLPKQTKANKTNL